MYKERMAFLPRSVFSAATNKARHADKDIGRTSGIQIQYTYQFGLVGLLKTLQTARVLPVGLIDSTSRTFELQRIVLRHFVAKKAVHLDQWNGPHMIEERFLDSERGGSVESLGYGMDKSKDVA